MRIAAAVVFSAFAVCLYLLIWPDAVAVVWMLAAILRAALTSAAAAHSW